MSFVLNVVTDSSITERTRARVRAAAHELRYRPNAAAKLLRTSRSHTIGFITDEIASTPFAGDIIKGAQEAAWEAGKILTIVNTDKNQKIEESAVEMMLERRVEGIIRQRRRGPRAGGLRDRRIGNGDVARAHGCEMTRGTRNIHLSHMVCLGPPV